MLFQLILHPFASKCSGKLLGKRGAGRAATVSQGQDKLANKDSGRGASQYPAMYSRYKLVPSDGLPRYAPCRDASHRYAFRPLLYSLSFHFEIKSTTLTEKREIVGSSRFVSQNFSVDMRFSREITFEKQLLYTNMKWCHNRMQWVFIHFKELWFI